MRTALQAQLDGLTRSIGEMCDFAGTAMQRATRALLEADIVFAESVISDGRNIAIQTTQTESDAFILLALQAPVATDLRAVVTSLQNVADVDRMRALAMHVAKIVRQRHPERAIPDDVSDHFAKMGRIAVKIGQSVRDAVLSGDPGKAGKLGHDDDAMDELHRDLFAVLMHGQWSHSVATAVDVTLLSRYYERFADHAVSIGRRIIFQASGRPGAPTDRFGQQPTVSISHGTSDRSRR